MATSLVLRRARATLRAGLGFDAHSLHPRLTLPPSLSSLSPYYELWMSGAAPWLFERKAPVVSVPKLRLKKDRYLDTMAAREKAYTPLIKVRDMILHHKAKAVPVSFIEIKKRSLGLRTSLARILTFLRRYHRIFELYKPPKYGGMLWCRLTKSTAELLEEERRIHREDEAAAVERLRKLLMISSKRRIRADKLALIRRDFGFPDDFLTGMVAKYPDFFTLSKSPKGDSVVQLAEWDESLAVSVAEKRAKTQYPPGLDFARSTQYRLSDDADGTCDALMETRGRPLTFKMSYSPGMQLKKKQLNSIAKWQELPYISPYQRADWIEDESLQAEKRIVAVLHELLSLTITKKLQLEKILLLKKEYRLPEKIPQFTNRFAGIFYVSLKGAVLTIVLREAYKKSHLLPEHHHPLIDLKRKYFRLMSNDRITRLPRARKEKQLGEPDKEQIPGGFDSKEPKKEQNNEAIFTGLFDEDDSTDFSFSSEDEADDGFSL